MRGIEQAVDRWLAAYDGQGLEVRFRAELALGFALFQFVAFALFSAAELTAGTPAMGYIHLGAQLPLLLCVALLRRGTSINCVGLVLNANIFLDILLVILTSGGRAVGGVIALPAFVLVALILSSRRQGIIWIALVVAAIALAQYLRTAVAQPWVTPSSEWLDRAVYRVPFLISIAFAFIAITIKRALRRYREELQAAQAEERSSRAEAAINAQRFAAFANLAADGFWETDADLRLQFVSPSFIGNLGLSADRVIGMRVDELFSRLSADPSDVAALGALLERGEDFSEELIRVTRSGGATLWLRGQGQAIRDGDGAFAGYRGAIHDISRQRQTEQSLRSAEQRLRTIADNIPALISYIDADRVFRFNNQTYAQWLNRPLSEITGKSLTEVYAPPTYARIKPYLDRAFGGEEVSFELERSRRRDRHIRVTYVPHVASGGDVVGVYGMIHDITRFKEIEQQLRELSQKDGLTQLANRRFYDERLGHAIALSDRTGQALALLFLDLDRFKPLNDQLGHEAGDLALCEFARRLKMSVRQSDTVARLGGDEFVIILENQDSVDAAITVAEKILAAMQQPLQLTDRSWDWSTSIGIAYRDGPGMDEEALLRAADQALYAAKAAGRGGYAVAEPEAAAAPVPDQRRNRA